MLKNLRRFSKEQQAIINSVDDVQMVLASAGSGKTTTAIEKAAKYLASTDQNIQVLTFSEAAKSEYDSRINDNSGRVSVDTFHGFGSKIIEQYNPQQLNSASSIQIQEICDDILNRQSDDLISPRNAPTLYSKFLSNKLFPLLKTSNLSPDEFKTICAKSLENSRPNFLYKRGVKKGSLKPSWSNEEKKIKRLVLLADLLPFYEDSLKKNALYDFSDMISFSSKIMEDESIRYAIQEQYSMLIVDEFQDTSLSQLDFLGKLYNPELHDQMVVVGDLRQTIYEFQAARLEVASKFIEKYNPKVFQITKSFRCSSVIVEKSDELISHSKSLSEEFGIKNVEAAKEGGRLDLIEFNTIEEEISWIIDIRLKEILDKEDTLENTAIIGLKHRQLEPIRQALQSKSIPYKYKRETNLNQTEIYTSFIEVIDYLIKPSKSNFFKIFQTPIFWNHNSKLLKNNQEWEKTDLHEKLMELSRISNASFVYRRFIEIFVSNWIRTTNAYRHHVDIANSLFYQLQDCRTLIQVKQRLASMKASPIFVRSTFDKKGGVNIETCHSAKGKEFTNIILVDFTKNGWEPRKIGIQLPEHFSGVDEKDANRRALYVALTRAKSEVDITYSKNKDKPQKLAFYASELNLTSIEEKDVEVSILFSSKEGQQQIEIEGWLQDPWVLERIESHPISYSSLHLWEKDRYKWFLSYIFRIPTPQSQSAVLGTMLHEAIELKTRNPKLKKSNLTTTIFNRHISKVENISRSKHLLKAIIDKTWSNWHFEGLSEQKIKIEYKGREIKVFLDSISDGIVTDFKSGRYKKQKAREYKAQLAFYSMICELNDNHYDYCLYFLEEDLKLNFNSNQLPIIEIKERLDSFIEWLASVP